VRVEVVENAGHAMLPEQQEAIARAVLSFLDGLKETGALG
jgi:hypothetical protein